MGSVPIGLVVAAQWPALWPSKKRWLASASRWPSMWAQYQARRVRAMPTRTRTARHRSGGGAGAKAPASGSVVSVATFAGLAEVDQGGERPAGGADRAGTDTRKQFGVDLLARFRLHLRGGAASSSQGHDQLAAIVFVGGTLQVATRHQCVDELAGGLLGHAQLPDQFPQRHAALVECHAANQVQAVLRNIVIAGVAQCPAHGRAVNGSRVAEQGRRHDLLVPVRCAGHGGSLVRLLDSQYT